MNEYTSRGLRRKVLANIALFATIPVVLAAFSVRGDDQFSDLDELLNTPNIYRTASGAPGHAYWQQKVDYKIAATLDEEGRRIEGKARIIYHNNSPDTLGYLWLQLEQNRFRRDSRDNLSRTFSNNGGWDKYVAGSSPEARDQPYKTPLFNMHREQFTEDHNLGFRIHSVTGASGHTLSHAIVGTLMRVDLPVPLAPGQSVEFSIHWDFQLVEQKALATRSGYENFPSDARDGGNDIFLVGQWFPRLAVYSDYEGWHNTEFMRVGEFTLEFGDYDVAITVPDDHIVAATGTLQNGKSVLTKTQLQRLKRAESAEKPVFIVTAEEALNNEKSAASGVKTWRFKANNVRDFAWASSRKYIWDAQGYKQPGANSPLVMAMSFYPKEAEPLWSQYSTQAIIHTLETYSRFTFDYPYPTAQSVNGPTHGMEYPMLAFNLPYTDLEEDGTRTYSRSQKHSLVGVVIHEVGHNYFPMIVNSDERKWAWMDEGLNSFLNYVALREWNDNPETLPVSRGEPHYTIPQMQSAKQVPLMARADLLQNPHGNAYVKTSAALTILRETILGRELFDFAFKQYARRWQFKRPTPEDFFRTMEEASGVDLDWFWRGWFYSTNYVDISLDRVSILRIDSKNPDIEAARKREEAQRNPRPLTVKRNQDEGIQPRVKRYPWLRDFYNEHDIYTVTTKDRKKYQDYLDGLEEWERTVFLRTVDASKYHYILEFSNLGGLVMPIILGITYEDGSEERLTLPAEIWRYTPDKVDRLLVRDKPVASIVVDPDWETADANIENNYYPRRIAPARLELYQQPDKPRNLMRDANTEVKNEKQNAQ